MSSLFVPFHICNTELNYSLASSAIVKLHCSTLRLDAVTHQSIRWNLQLMGYIIDQHQICFYGFKVGFHFVFPKERHDASSPPSIRRNWSTSSGGVWSYWKRGRGVASYAEEDSYPSLEDEVKKSPGLESFLSQLGWYAREGPYAWQSDLLESFFTGWNAERALLKVRELRLLTADGQNNRLEGNRLVPPQI